MKIRESQKIKIGQKVYSYANEIQAKRVHELEGIDFWKIEMVGKIWATVMPGWGKAGKRLRGLISVKECLAAQSCPECLSEEQFAVFSESPFGYIAFFKYREKAKGNESGRVRVWKNTAENIDKYIQKYQHLLPAEEEPETPAEQPAPENISN